MGFSSAAIKSIKNNRTLQNRHSFFKSKALRKQYKATGGNKKNKLSSTALSQIEADRANYVVRVSIFLLTILSLCAYTVHLLTSFTF